MPSKIRVKTYGKPKKIDSNYVPKPVSPFKITEASTAIDALFSKNIKKRKSLTCNEEKKGTRGCLKKAKVSELPKQTNPLLMNDSFNIKINSTFDDLLQGPVYNQVNICNTSALCVDNSTDTSKSKNTSSIISYYHTRKKDYKNGILRIKKCCNNNESKISLSGKIKKRKNNSKKLKQVIKNVVLNISDISSNNHNISKKIHSYLDKSVNCSLIIERVPRKKKIQEKSYKCARKFTPIASSKIVHHHDSDKIEHDFFRPGFRRLMQADNTPKLFHSSTPLVARTVKIDDKFYCSPIHNLKTTLNFTANNSKSLFESNKLNSLSSIHNTGNISPQENVTNNVILINSTIPEVKIIDDNEILGDKVQNIILMPQNNDSLIIINEDNSISDDNKITVKTSLIANDKKLNGKAVVRLERHLDIIGINKNTSIICNFTTRQNRVLERIPVICLERMSFSKYIQNIQAKSKSRICTRSQSIKALSNDEKSKTCVDNERTDLSLFSTNKSDSNNIVDVDCIIVSPKNLEKSLKNKLITDKKKKRISNNIEKNTAKDILPSKINDNTRKSENYITTRKKKIRLNLEQNISNYNSNECEKPYNISLKTWKMFSNCKVILEKLEHLNENYAKLNREKAINNNDNLDVNINRGNIILQPGKKWFRSLSILRRTNFYGTNCKELIRHTVDQQNVCERNSIIDASTEIDESGLHDMKHKINSSNRTVRIRKSLKIVNISVKDSSLFNADNTTLNKKSGYVSTLTHVSILESFDKLSLSTSADDREETSRQLILKHCGQAEPVPFDECYSSRILKKCRKIGEGVYGEVYMYKSADNNCRVLKIIPIEGDLEVNGERQKKFEEIISEIIIATELSNLRKNDEFCTNGFAELLQVSCVQGRYPQHLLELWDLYDEQRGSENDSPAIFNEDQLYIVLELANGGQDLESYRFNNAEQCYALFVQAVCSLAVAESALEFEHRDMHWGNILISPTDDTTITYRLKGRKFEIAARGVKVSVIDFTLSRMTYKNCCIYNDLAADPDLFSATGDYQFDIYRLMKQRNLNEWQIFEPYSNILWLDYTLEKMIKHVRYLREDTKTHKTYIRKLSQIRKKILNFNSATELLNSDIFSHVFL